MAIDFSNVRLLVDGETIAAEFLNRPILDLIFTLSSGFGTGAFADWAVTNTPNTLAMRNASGDFAAGTITASLSGNASTATALQTSRTINSVAFNGTQNIQINRLMNNGLTVFEVGESGGNDNRLFVVSSAGSASATLGVGGSGSGGIVVTGRDSDDSSVRINTYNAAAIDFRPGSSGVRIWDTDKSNYWIMNTGNLSANRALNFPTDGNVTLVSGIMVPTNGAGATGTWGINVSGNAATATQWATARTLSLTGHVSGSATVSGAADISVATTIPSRTMTLAGDITGSATVPGAGNFTVNASVADTGWNTLTLVNGFSHDPFSSLQFRRVAGIVYVIGIIQRATTPSYTLPIGNLPVGYRPSKNIIFTGHVAQDTNMYLEAGSGSLDPTGLLRMGLPLPVVQSGAANNFRFTINFSFPVD